MRRSVGLLSAATVVVSVLPLVAQYWWVLDLFTHFKFQLLVTQVLLAIALLGQGRTRAAVALAIVLGINALAARDYLIPRTAATRYVPDLRVMTANVLADNTRSDGLIAQIERERPDVLAILEFNAGWAERLLPIAADYPHHVEAPRPDRFGIALFTRAPIVTYQVFDLSGTPAIDATIETAAGEVRVIAAHAVPPVSSAGAAQRRRQLDALATHAASAGENIVVLGDLNVSPFSPHFRGLLERSGLHDALAGHGPTLTWPTFLPPLGIVIDHCLLGSDWDSIGYRRQPAYGSDHFAVVVDLTRNAVR